MHTKENDEILLFRNNELKYLFMFIKYNMIFK